MKTYAELAAKLNVSTATVSNALSGKGRMSPQLRADIIQMAEQSGLEGRRRRPARNLYHVNIITEDLSIPFCNQIIAGIAEQAEAHGMVATVHSLSVIASKTSDISNEKISHKIQQLLLNMNTYTSGIVYVSQYPRDLDQIFPVLPCPVVYTYGTATANAYSVLCDDEQGAYLATSHLIEIGRQQLAMICGPIDNFPTSNRFVGFQRAIVTKGLSFAPHMIRVGEWVVEDGYAAMKDLLEGPHVPDAVFAHNDKMAIGALRAVIDMGLRIPEDIAIVGFDNFTSRYSTPAITSIHAPLKEVGEKALTLLAQILQGEAPKQRTYHLPCTLVKRASTIGTQNMQ